MTEELIKARIYRINNDIDDEFYVGGTTQTLSKRFGDHKLTATTKPNRKIYNHMNSLGADHFRIVLIEQIEVESKEQLRKKEDEYIRLLKPKLNMINSVLNIDELYQKNKVYKKVNKESIAKVVKKYACDHKEEIAQYKQEYATVHKDKLDEYRKAKVDCECGGKYTYCGKSQHLKSKIHREFINQ